MSPPRIGAAACAAVAFLLGCGDDGAPPLADAGGEAGPRDDSGAALPPAHVGAWFRCEDELCEAIAEDGFLLAQDGTLTELRGAASDAGVADDAGGIGEGAFSTSCEIPWGRYAYDGATLRIEPDRTGEAPTEVFFDVFRDVATLFHEDLSHTHYWRVEGASVGPCEANT